MKTAIGVIVRAMIDRVTRWPLTFDQVETLWPQDTLFSHCSDCTVWSLQSPSYCFGHKNRQQKEKPSKLRRKNPADFAFRISNGILFEFSDNFKLLSLNRLALLNM